MVADWVEDCADYRFAAGHYEPRLEVVVGVHVSGEDPLYSAVFYARARMFCINCDGAHADVEDWMLEVAEEPSLARMAREIGVRPQSVRAVLEQVRRDAPSLEAIVEVARRRWMHPHAVKVRWTARLRSARGLKPSARLVHAFLMHELDGPRPRPSWTDEQLASLLGYSVSGVRKMIASLTRRDLVYVERGRRSKASRYSKSPFPERRQALRTSSRNEKQLVKRRTQRDSVHDGTGSCNVTKRVAEKDETGHHPKTFQRASPRIVPKTTSSSSSGVSLDFIKQLAADKRVPEGSNAHILRRGYGW